MTIVPDRDDQVMSLLAIAMALDTEQRSGYLQVACDGDQELYEETRDALAWEERMGGFLRKPWMSLQELERPFHPGQVINNRFEVVREIGQGGMGIVYEAFDRKRGQRIAIKSAKLGFRRLLSPELESALRVRHPNICLVNEIHTAATDHGDVDFLTMELLEGLTLQACLSSGDPLEPEETLEIARQLCAGLAEAHRIGIVHKDLKTANVILTRMPDGSPRAAITDFGLAGEPTADSGDLAGTPRYMAPELWKGAQASKASDVYALGVMLYEMATGTTPFSDEPTQVRLTRRPAPSTRAAGLDKQLDAIISRCLDPSPTARPRDASEVLAALVPARFRKAPLLVTLVLLLLAGAALRAPLMKFFEPANVRLAILPVEGSGDDLDAVVDGALIDFTDRLSHRRGPPTLVVMPPSQSLASDVHTPEEARQRLDATHALQITLRRDGTGLLVRSTVIDLATQTNLEEISGRYSMSRAGDLPVALAGVVSKALQLRGESNETISVAATTPYVQGLAYLRRDQHSFDQALPLFRQAIQLDPRSPQPRAGAVEALVLKYKDTNDARWLGEAERALQVAESINPDSVAVLIAAGRLAIARGRSEEALESYERVAERQPRNVEVLLRIAEINTSLKRPKETIESYEKAIALDPHYYETYQELGVFYSDRGEYVRAAEQFRNAIARAPRFHEAYTNLGATLNQLGRDEEAIQMLQESLKIKETARALNNLAAIMAYQKRDAVAVDLYKKAYALDPGNYIFPLNLGDSSRRLGREAESRDYYQRGSELALKALQDNPHLARARAFVGYFAARLGDRRRGQQEIEQALQFDPGDKGVIRRAVLTYEMLGLRDRALTVAATMTADDLRELDRHPDLADFRQDLRFRELRTRKERGG